MSERHVAWSRRIGAALLICAAFSGLAGCRTGRNYIDVVPRFADSTALLGDRSPRAHPDSLRLVTFNIKHGRRISDAISVLTTDRALRQADIVVLQEMDSTGTSRIASALGMAYVFYPATLHRTTRRDFGNAVLSRWPIVNDSRVTLPHHSRVTRTQRIATAVTIRVGHRLIRVYSAHLGTLLDISQAQRRDQLERIIADAMMYPYVIVGGDMNSASVGPVARRHGYTWLTARNARTTIVGRWDHFFSRGFVIEGEVPAGISKNSRAASDHNAVWAVLPMREPTVLWRWPGDTRR